MGEIKKDIMDEVFRFIRDQPQAKIVNVPANTIVGVEGEKCLNFSLVLDGKIKVYKTSDDGKLITLYHINKNEGCILTSASIFNDLPLPAMAITTTHCRVISFPAKLLATCFNENKAWREFIFSMLLNKMAALVTMVDDLAFHKLEERLVSWLKNNQQAGVIEMTHQEIANQLASTREVISRSLKTLENKGLIVLSRGKIELV